MPPIWPLTRIGHSSHLSAREQASPKNRCCPCRSRTRPWSGHRLGLSLQEWSWTTRALPPSLIGTQTAQGPWPRAHGCSGEQDHSRRAMLPVRRAIDEALARRVAARAAQVRARVPGAAVRLPTLGAVRPGRTQPATRLAPCMFPRRMLLRLGTAVLRPRCRGPTAGLRLSWPKPRLKMRGGSFPRLPRASG